jgi:hypothetical protein
MKIPCMRRAGTCIGLLLAALVAAAPCYAAPKVAPSLLHTQTARMSGWLSADLDGDRKVDLAKAGASRRDGHGYLQEVTLRLSAFEDSTITVRTLSTAVRLTFRDLDGDADRDLVLETFDREPVAVLLNDGDGHFHQGDLEDFRFQLSHRSSRSLEATVPDIPDDDTSECPNDDSLASPFSSFWPDQAAACLHGNGVSPRPVEHHFGKSSRAPPLLP